MAASLAALMDRLIEDPWRKEVGLSPEIDATLSIVLDPLSQDDTIRIALNKWLAAYQPCLFGRLAAKHELITHCLIREEDLAASDEVVKRKIQEAHLAWTVSGFEGKASNFIISILSRRLALAIPDETSKQIPLRICWLYLEEDIEPDRVHMDRLWLEQPGNRRTTWEWLAGVNYFSAQGDKRWWQDHRIPAGLAFSVNSVGHMVKAGRLTHAMRDLEELMGTATGEFRERKVDSLEKALDLAMLTIDRASEGPSGKATSLIQVPPSARLPCPVKLSPRLLSKNHCDYRGLYHTDVTIPSEYFLPAVQRPEGLHEHTLDFTYLFDKSLDNPDFDRMGEGRRIRKPDGLSARDLQFDKRLRGLETEVEISAIPRLRIALGR
jgi:hypothetical protein